MPIQRSNTAAGVSLYLTLLVVSSLLAVALGLSTIALLQVKSISGLSDSVHAFYAADSGIEKSLFDENEGVDTTSCTRTSPCVGNIDANTQYRIVVLSSGAEECPMSASSCLETVGLYKAVRRAIRVTK